MGYLRWNTVFNHWGQCCKQKLQVCMVMSPLPLQSIFQCTQKMECGYINPSFNQETCLCWIKLSSITHKTFRDGSVWEINKFWKGQVKWKIYSILFVVTPSDIAISHPVCLYYHHNVGPTTIPLSPYFSLYIGQTYYFHVTWQNTFSYSKFFNILSIIL